MEEPKFRHELKYLCSDAELKMLEIRMNTLMQKDPHVGPDGCYEIRSIYMDDLYNSSYFENEDGVSPREKWRIRTYNCSDTRISLECKRKENGMIRKTACLLKKEEFDALVNGGQLLPSAERPKLLNRFLVQRLERGIKPAVIVRYTRRPFIYEAGNVRVTFDMNIGSSPDFDAFFDKTLRTRTVLPAGMQLLEVKYDEYIPDTVYHCIQSRDMQLVTFSKYFLCRQYHL